MKEQDLETKWTSGGHGQSIGLPSGSVDVVKAVLKQSLLFQKGVTLIFQIGTSTYVCPLSCVHYIGIHSI